MLENYQKKYELAIKAEKEYKAESRIVAFLKGKSAERVNKIYAYND
jgi:hypothetical protein